MSVMEGNMIKLLHTGDWHLGRSYSSVQAENPEAAARYSGARVEALRNLIRTAGTEGVDYIVAAGDIFDSKQSSKDFIGTVCGILAEAECPVIIIPGNHDYYEQNDPFWKKVKDAAEENTVILTDSRPFEPAGGNAVFYPCICHDRYSEGNALLWLKEFKDRNEEKVNIGIAHGALEGLSFDREKKYYYMTREELTACSMDLWLLGHSHVPYPNTETIYGEGVFNAGTHQQTDMADRSPGSAFIITVDDDKQISAKMVMTGVLHFRRLSIVIGRTDTLTDKIERAISGINGDEYSLRIDISGYASPEDFEQRQAIYDFFSSRFISFEVTDDGLKKQITPKMIDAETIEGTLENRLLKKYTDAPELLELAMDIVESCRKGELS